MLRQLTLILITTICYSQQIDVTKVYPFASVESPPIFDTCLNMIDKDKKKCFEQYVNSHIQENLSYPDDAFDSQTGGRVLVSFIIDRNGYVSEVNTRGPNESLENEVKRVINLLSKSQPAKINGISVDMNYALPVSFYLLSVYNNQEITIADGANIYELPDLRSKQVFYTRSESTLNAKKEGRFWLVEFNEDGTLLGYVSEDDVLSIDQNKPLKNELSQTNIVNEQININKEVTEKKQGDTNNLQLLKTQEDDVNKDNLVITKEDPLLKEYELDKLKLASFIQKLEIQKETDRRVPGINKSDLYYGNALKELIKILEKEIETKYLILSNKNPSIFYNTDFDIRKRSNKNKADRLINNLESIPYDFVKQNFYSFPSINDTKRFDELIQELDNLEYIVIEEPSLDETLRSIKQVKLVENPVERSQPNISTDSNQKIAKMQNDSTNKSQLNNGDMVDQNNDKTIKSSDIDSFNISINSPNKTLDVESAKKRLKDLFFLFSQDLISKEVYEEFAIELRQIIDNEDKKNTISTSNLKISPKEALERIRSLRSFLDQGLISKETYEDAVKVLKDIATNIDEN